MNKKHLLALTVFLFAMMVVFSRIIGDLIKDHSSQIIMKGGLLLVFFVLSLGISFIVLRYVKYS